ncbi:MAG: response regulator, partial [Bacteroidales bacterium]|nr:response regulator [Bacteroidales bacterium]
NQLLEFRKIEAGKIKLQAGNQNITSFVATLCEAFDELAESRNISFKKQLRLKEPDVYFDSERLGVVINNLLSNAFKFVGTPGQVEVILSETSTEVSILIKNNGKGISNQDMKHLFERFYQASGKRSVGSSGIGLALVKNYVELHKGRVEVESDPGHLTTFSVILPKGNQHLSDDELKQSENSIDQVIATQPLPVVKKSRSVNTGTKGARVMLVEDNEEVRSYLSDLLAEEFEILEAADGIEAFDLVIEHKPQIVISDVMMPRMDGFELCQKIKSNDTVAHIPVVLLTAKGAPQDQLFGARKGADLYLTKPFEPELLIEKVKQLIASRDFLSEKYSKKVKLEPTDAVIQSDEAVLLEKAIKIVEKNISDPHFDSDILAKELAMSTSTFYRRIKKITDKTPGEFIKTIKLKRAAQLLRETNLTVSEIIEDVGYQDIKNFRKNFKQLYGQTPTDYRKTKE